MATIPVPIVDENLSTSNPSNSLKKFALGSVGIMVFFAMIALGKYLYNRARATAGVGQDNNPVPGV
jgi:hypothetical protein